MVREIKQNPKIKLSTQIAIFLSIVLPVILLTIFNYIKIKKDLYEFTFTRRQAIAQIASIYINEKFTRLKEIGQALATRSLFLQHIKQEEWEKALDVIDYIPQQLSFIDRIFLVDLNGNLLVDFPVHPEVRGKNFAFREWYQKVRQEQRPYLTNIYKRSAIPQINVISMAFPIQDEKGKMLGILVLQLSLERLFDWTKKIDVGTAGHVYLVDRQGNIAGHPLLQPQAPVINYSKVPVVQKVLAGKKDIEITFNPIEKEEQIVAYGPVPEYGWGIIVQQPTAEAFASQDSHLRLLLLSYIIFFLLSCLLAVFVLKLISRRYQLDQEQAARQAAEKGIQLRDDFISVASHELKTPLTALKVQLQVFPRLLQKTNMPGQEKILSLLQKSLRQLNLFVRLVDELLDVTRISSGQLLLQFEEVNLSAIVTRVIEQCRPEIEEAGCDISTRLDMSLQGPWDPIRIEQIVVNLVSNAIKYGRGGPIEIVTEKKQGMALLTVRDQGIGIAKDDHRKIFERFERVASVNEFRGLGLGLYITHQMVKAHGGSIHVESDKGKGSTFTVELPLQ